MIFRFVVIPMTLFSGTFFPIDQLPAWLQPAGVDLAAVARHRAGPRRRARPAGSRCRALGHLAYLVGAGWSLGLVLSARVLRRRLAARDERHRRSAARTCCRLGALGEPLARAACCVERNLLVYRRTWLVVRLRLLRAAVLPAGDRASASARWSATSPGPAARRSATPPSSRPALLAASAMNGAVFDSTFNVFFKLKYAKLYDAMLATPLGPVDVALGEIGWALLRGGLYALGFLVVHGRPRAAHLARGRCSPCRPRSLIGVRLRAPSGMAATSFMRSWQDFDLVTLVILPMFLFSTTFYPLTVYPRWLQVVVECLPLYHARRADARAHHRRRGPAMLGHLAYFAVMIAVGRHGGRAPPRRSPAELTRCGEAGVAGPLGGVDDGRMSVLSQRSARLDIVRSAVVAVLAILQIVVAAMAGGSVAAVANTLRTPVLAANWAFAIWAPIYLGFLLYAGYQLLPAQRGREVHRRTGWWTAASAVLNPAWILAFSGRVILLAELLLVALLVVLAVVFGRLSREPAADRIERAAFRGPIALYTGWVSMATVLGTAATGPGPGPARRQCARRHRRGRRAARRVRDRRLGRAVRPRGRPLHRRRGLGADRDRVERPARPPSSSPAPS